MAARTVMVGGVEVDEELIDRAVAGLLAGGGPARLTGAGNSPNGSSAKTVRTEIGELDLDVPWDRGGSFASVLVPKGRRHLDGLTAMITSLYAGGMTVRDIERHLHATLGVDVPPATISAITDAMLTEVKTWQVRPLDPVWPIVYVDALVVKIRALAPIL